MALFIYEEAMLLAIRNKKGNISSEYIEFALAAALLAELSLLGCIDFSDKSAVKQLDTGAVEDDLLNECLAMLVQSDKAISLEKWLSKIVHLKDLKHKVARQLCRKGILAEQEDKILLIFSRKLYPEIDPLPEREIVARLREAITNPNAELSSRTTILLSIASSTGLLKYNIDSETLSQNRQRIKDISKGDAASGAAKEAIQAYEMLVVMTAIMPTIITTTVIATS